MKSASSASWMRCRNVGEGGMARTSAVKDWLALLRVPNLFTAPGDPLAGYFLAAGVYGGWSGRLVMVMVASVLFYGAGLLFNDLADRNYDAQYNPERPLASQRVSVGAVRAVGIVMMGVALVLSFFGGGWCLYVGLALAACIVLYDFVLKGVPVAGAVCMGACRGVSLLLGAGVAGGRLSSSVLAAALVLTLYVAAVTSLARGEKERGRSVAFRRWLPLGAFVVGGTLFIIHLPPLLSAWRWLVIIIAVLLVVLMAGVGARAGKGGALPGLIGRLIAAIIFMQVMFIVASGHPHAGLMVLGLMACAFAHYRLARVFYAS
ncbi:MAG: hypothetical protein EOM20_20975 [Spartobacteria bacterium]|nr:hypothetical protein [Spartobacteria bacterium]